MSVHYKFGSALAYKTVSFNGLEISVADLKKAIFRKENVGNKVGFDFKIKNAQTKEYYTGDNALIDKHTEVIVVRVPSPIERKGSWKQAEVPIFSNAKEEATLGRFVDLTKLNGSEEDKIRIMMAQSTHDYDPSNYMKIPRSNQSGPVPRNYRCYKCRQPGHWIKNCPLETDEDKKPIRIRKSTGIPRSFMVPVEGPSIPGAMMTPEGIYAVPLIDQQVYKENRKVRLPFVQDPEPLEEKPVIPEELLCNICKNLLTVAAMIPCCGKSFCDECIRTLLLESEERECPQCNKKDVSPNSLVPDHFQRKAVLNFENETAYAKRSIKKPSPPPSVEAKPVIKDEPPISKTLTALPSTSAATPAQTPLSSAEAEASYEKACYRVPPPPSYSDGPAPPSLPNPYMAPPLMPMYPPPHHAPGPSPPPPAPHAYGLLPPLPLPQYYYGIPPYGEQPGYSPNQPSRTYSWPRRPMHGMHNNELPRNDCKREAFERMLREKADRDCRLGKHRGRRASRSQSHSQRYSRGGIKRLC